MPMKASTLHKLLAPVARLPFGALYAVSSVAAAALYHVVRYRRNVVRDNLKACFPDADGKWIKNVEKRFYLNFTDNVVETLKLLHIKDATMAARMEFRNTEIIDRLLSQGKSIVVYFGHFFNWEWAPSVSLHTTEKPSDKFVFAQVYRPLRSKAFDGLMLGLRSRFDSESIDKSRTLRRLIELQRSGRISITGFMSDQHPSHGDPGYITTLLGRPTAMISGTETLARRLGMAVIYWDIEKTSRGHYRITTRLMSENAADEPQGSLTGRYTRLLETTIRRDPALWLWSHKRWKHPVTLPEK